jgi:membrane associated rhomboid family serine protease
MPATNVLIGLNIVVFMLESAMGTAFTSALALWPLGAGFFPTQLVTYAFVHVGLMHIAFNMIGVLTFGRDLELLWGTRRFVIYYFACAIAAALTQLGVGLLTGSASPTAGASGAVFGLLLAYALRFPQRRLMLLFPPIPMRAPVFAVVYGVIELVLGVTGTQEGVAHFAHLGGMAGGFLVLWYWSRRRVRW